MWVEPWLKNRLETSEFNNMFAELIVNNKFTNALNFREIKIPKLFMGTSWGNYIIIS